MTGSYPRQNGLAIALREAGRLERSIFMLNWLRDVDLRRRSQGGLNKGEARNALARAISRGGVRRRAPCQTSRPKRLKGFREWTPLAPLSLDRTRAHAHREAFPQ